MPDDYGGCDVTNNTFKIIRGSRANYSALESMKTMSSIVKEMYYLF